MPYHEDDTYVPLEKQFKMMEIYHCTYMKIASKLVKMGIPISIIRDNRIFDDVIKMKYDIPKIN